MTLRSNMRVLAIGAAVAALVGVLSVNASATGTYSAVAWTFVGTANQCSPSPAGNKIVTSGWQNGLGLPDDGTANPAGGTPHQGLLLNKNGPTPNCSSAGASIVGWTSGNVLNAIGFDYRVGGHCGSGAPRLNVVDTSNNVYFFGCASGTASPAPQDPTNWTRITFNAAGAPYPGAELFVFGATPVATIDIVFDEGTDTPSPDGSEPAGVGLATLDNIRINNTLITKKAGNPILP
jgi:hypothetical protein